MWKAHSDEHGRGSYEIALTDDTDSSGADARTLVGDEDEDEDNLPLSPDELAFNYPLKQKHALDSTPLTPRWTKFAQRLRWWKNEPSEQLSFEEEHLDEEEETTDLLNNSWSSYDRWTKVGETAVSWLIWPLPSWSHQFFLRERQPPETKRPTDYLDGLRGFASLFVFFDHYLVGLKTDIVQYGYGADGHWSIFQLPFIRTVYSGSAMVAIFFVISGYVLSARCIVAMRAGNMDKLTTALTSMTFRRGMRLFVPSIASSMITLFAVFIGLLQPKFPAIWSVGKELHDYWEYLHEDLFKLWTWELSYEGWYAPQLWTIPLEFKCSMVLFMVVLAVARCRCAMRLIIELSLMWYLFFKGRWDVATFIAGMTIAELNIIRDERRTARDAARCVLAETCSQIEDAEVEKQSLDRTQRSARFCSCSSFFKQLFMWAVFVFGVYLTGYPGSDAAHTPGYAYLSNTWMVDEEYKFRFWLAISAILVVGSTSYLPLAQRFFSTNFARYLGKISYALYLVHVLMNRTLRYALWSTFWGIMQYESEEGDDAKFEGGWFLGTVIYVPCVLWAADIFWRMIDVPSVRLAKWVEDKCFVSKKK